MLALGTRGPGAPRRSRSAGTRPGVRAAAARRLLPGPAAPAGGAPRGSPCPGRGSSTLLVWLTNAAGNDSEADAARTTLTVPQPTASVNAPSSEAARSAVSTGDASVAMTSSGTSSHKVSIRVTELLRGRRLIVHVRGPASGSVRVTQTCRYPGRVIASGSKIGSLRDETPSVTFKLSPRAVARGTIRVSASIGDRTVVTSMLRRQRVRKRRS
jgi:hypothetical protein